MSKHELIKQYITDNPGLTDGELATMLNTTMVQQPRRVPMSELHEWANIHRVARRFYDSEGAVVHPVLKMELEQLIQGKQDSVNVLSETAGVSGLVTDLVAAGILSMEEVAELQQLGYQEVSLAQSLGIGSVTLQDVIDARGAM
jgi:hypothetical protein